MKKFLSIILAFISITSVCIVTAIAAEKDTVQPCYSRFVSIETELNLGSGKANYEGTALTAYDTDKIYVTAYLQQKINGIWTTVGSASANGSQQASAYGSCKIDSGYYYRIRVDAKVYNLLDYMLESVTEYSSERYY